MDNDQNKVTVQDNYFPSNSAPSNNNQNSAHGAAASNTTKTLKILGVVVLGVALLIVNDNYHFVSQIVPLLILIVAIFWVSFTTGKYQIESNTEAVKNDRAWYGTWDIQTKGNPNLQFIPTGIILLPVTKQGWLIDISGIILIAINVLALLAYYFYSTNPSTNPWFLLIAILPSIIIFFVLLWVRKKFGPFKM